MKSEDCYEIEFDDNGISNHWHNYFKRQQRIHYDHKFRDSHQKKLVSEIKTHGKNKVYDSIIGVSGGVDSSYLAYFVKKELQLNPLVIHVDTGWNSLESTNNIEKIIDNLELDLQTIVIPWKEMRDLQLSFFKAQHPNLDIPQDHAIFGSLYKYAIKNNIKIVESENNKFITLNERLKIKPILVPHRDEYSETVGYNIVSDKKSALYVSDIDKWHLWNLEVKDLIKKTDYAFLDGTFFKNDELDRDMSAIPHPIVHESMKHFSTLSKSDKQKIYFIHFNHTNPLLHNNSVEQKEVKSKGFRIAKEKQIIKL